MLRNYKVRRDVLKYERVSQHLSQQTLAERAGLSLGQISRIETGHIESPHFKTIAKLSEALSVPENDLYEPLLEDPR